MFQELLGKYAVGKTIGSGGFAKVKMATHVATGEQVAIKIMNKKFLKDDLPRVYQEIGALENLFHPNICKLYEVIESETHVFLVMEYCAGGELFDHIVQKEKLEEDEAKTFFRQIVAAVAYCHALGFAHRDLKPENILLANENTLKMVDFGLCVRPQKGVHLGTSCGSPNYAAPELLRGEKYLGPQIDIWSLGVMLYALLCGNLPFDDDVSEKLYARILRGKYYEPEWLSEDSKDLIRSLLKVDPKERLTTQQLCQHPWLNKGFDVSVKDLSMKEEPVRREDDCLRILASHLGMTINVLWSQLATMEFNYNMASYRILLQRKQSRLPLRKLRPPLHPISTPQRDNMNIKSPDRVEDGATFVIKRKREAPAVGRDGDFATPGYERRPVGGRRASKRIRSPGLEEREPTTKKARAGAKPEGRASFPSTPVVTSNERRSIRTPLSARKVLDGIERGIRQVLTPRRSSGRAEPAVLTYTNMANVTSTNSTDPAFILQVLQTALRDKGISSTINGYALCGKVTRGGVGERTSKLSFELEVCWIPQGSGLRSRSPDMKGAVVGIRRKRLKGDAWIYKCICEEVLAIAAAY